ncbi:MAG: S41 family peptidase, partial [candidate division Zixibacteria bacterium]
IKPGDRIIAIDSVETAGLEIKEIRSLMRGPAGSLIDLRIHRPGDREYHIVTKRDEVRVKAIPHYAMISQNVGYIRLLRFSAGCYKELMAAIAALKKQGMESLVFDLRDNPGGLLSEAIDVSGAFLPVNSIIVEARGRRESIKGLYVSQDPPLFSSGGLVILVDSQTASAAEIVAGAVQDHDRGVVVGTETYGKGLVQQILKLSEQSALKITASKYYLPAGRCLQKPDWSTFELVSENITPPAEQIFMTDSGRPVFSGGGILPDVYLDEKTESAFVEALKKESFFFDFATAYIKDNQVEPELEIDENIMLDFKEFVEKSDFRFEEKDRTAFDDFKDNFMAPDSESEDAMEILDQKLQSKEQWFFDSNYLEIADNLEESILLQAFGEENIYDIWISKQPQIAEAVNILSDLQKYNSILAQR